MKYCESVYFTKRFKTRVVMVGNVGVGGENPIRMQSMATSSTSDVAATIDQIIKLADAGCEIVRVTVQGMKEADACGQIKEGLIKKGYDIPLVADIHFYPPAAMRVIDFVDKVRINPGNFVDKRATFQILEYDDETYAKELEKIEESFFPLVEKCKKLKRSMRIGTNHGSLSDRIMNRYGNTPEGMVESALEFANVCRKYDYHDFMFSMKASNPQVMIQAYRLLVAKMIELGWDYPLHLGVTEAGEGEDGRIKSAMGMGSLLLDGIGDTIRVSLTEDPWKEIDPCRRLVKLAESYEGKGVSPFVEKHRNIENLSKRSVNDFMRKAAVILRAENKIVDNSKFYEMIGCENLKSTTSMVDYLVFDKMPENEIVEKLKDVGIGILQPVSLLEAKSTYNQVVYIENESQWEILKKINPAMILLRPKDNRLHFCRKFFEWITANKLEVPVILNFHYSCSKQDLVIQASAECGALFCDGLGEGIFLEGSYDIQFLRKLSFNILQSAGIRITKTEFISCPGCGRTLFNIQEVTKRIRAKTGHLSGVKIAVMGCIVNGPGEMADADFGYVGSAPGKIDLYVGKECVEKNIDFADAEDRLIELIKTHNRWVDF